MNMPSPKLAAAIQPYAAEHAAAYVEALPVTPEGVALRLATQLYDQAWFNHGANVWMRLPEDSPHWVEDRGGYFMRKRTAIALRQISVMEAGVLAAIDRSEEGQARAMAVETAALELEASNVGTLILELAADILDREPDLDF